MAKLKPRVLVLGAGGMLGHVLATYLEETQPGNQLFQARKATTLSRIDANLILLDVLEEKLFRNWIEGQEPLVVVNCIAAKSVHQSLEPLNAGFPVVLADLLDRKNDGSRLIQISSDGVFSGKSGSYSEVDVPDAKDAYGISKIRGEVSHGNHLTIRTSFIGHALNPDTGLLDWFLQSKSPVNGFDKAFWSGVTSLELARFIEYVILNQIKGLVHFGGSRISKHELLENIASVYGKSIEILHSDENPFDRSLRSVRKDIHFDVPPISAMLYQYRDWYGRQVIRGL